MDRTVEKLIQLLAEGRPAVAATIIESRGSTPRSAGTTMVLLEDGSFLGTVGGGVVELMAQRHCREILAKGSFLVEEYDIEAESCAGISGNSPAAAQSKGSQRLLIRLLDGRQGAVQRFAALLRTSAAGGRWWVTVVGAAGCQNLAAGSDGLLPGQRPPAQPPALKDLLRPEPVLLRRGEDLWFAQPLGSEGRVCLFGAGHVARELAAQLHRVFFEVVLIDDRPQLATEEFFPEVQEIFIGEPREAFRHFAPGGQDYVVAMTKGPATDRAVLAGALKTSARYIGVLGSSRKISSVFAQLSADYGYSKADLDRVYAPIGLDIGGETPEEIALGVAAQLIQVRYGKEKV